ncbi:MAG: metal-dependent hydrolase [Nitrospinaceae bacterium]|nr:MAG: metal-dependent hydrolase [Nitrospinaceae bacterium]
MSRTLKIQFKALLPVAGEVIENGELLIEQGRIQEVSRRQTGSSPIDSLDLSDHLLVPGFVNAHCHLSLSALHDKVPKLEKFTDWVRALLNENIKLPWDERVRAVQTGALQLSGSGVTTLADILSQPELLPEYAALPFRQVQFLEVLGFKQNRVQEILARVTTIFNSQNPKGHLLQLGLAPHAPYSVSPVLFRELKKLAGRYDCPFTCHVAEFFEEERFLKEGGGELQEFLEERGVFDDDWQPPGKSPVRYLDEIGALDSMVGVHLNHIADDLGLLAARNASAVFCPGSTRWFGRTRFMPVRKLLDAGVKVGLGSDSLASNESLNFLRELRIADEMLPDVSRSEILKMATAGGASALGLSTGALVPGMSADLIGFRVQENPNAWTDVPFDPGRERVDFSMVAGNVVHGKQNIKNEQ